MELLHRADLPTSGFEGVREQRLVFDQRIAGEQKTEGAWQGLGDFVYLADAHLIPGGETKMHSHHEIDVITLMLSGRLEHQGSLEHGKSLEAFDVQVQRAGGEGFSHNEINPDDQENRLIQIWALPPDKGEPASYKHYQPGQGLVSRVYGGPAGQEDVFASETCIDVARLNEGQSMDVDKPALIYVCSGMGFVHEDPVEEGDLLRDEHFTYDATEDSVLVIVHKESDKNT